MRSASGNRRSASSVTQEFPEHRQQLRGVYRFARDAQVRVYRQLADRRKCVAAFDVLRPVSSH
jgi:hypothetical protein